MKKALFNESEQQLIVTLFLSSLFLLFQLLFLFDNLNSSIDACITTGGGEGGGGSGGNYDFEDLFKMVAPVEELAEPSFQTQFVPQQERPPYSSKKSALLWDQYRSRQCQQCYAVWAQICQNSKNNRRKWPIPPRSVFTERRSSFREDVSLEAAQADFALRLLREVSKNFASSTVVSPLSVALPLAMVYAGARDRTRAELSQLFTGRQDVSNSSLVHAYFGGLLKKTQKQTHINNIETIEGIDRPTLMLEMVNKVYLSVETSLLKHFRETIEQHYGIDESTIEMVDFTRSAEATKKINDFVAKVTHHKIHDLVGPDVLDGQTSLVLVNAVYFSGRWKTPFKPNHTKKQPFHAAEGAQSEVNMMHNSDDNFFFFEDQELQLLGLPYASDGDRLKMTLFVLLPRKRFGLQELLLSSGLSGRKLLDLFQKSYKSPVDVHLPKFKLESTHDLNDPLERLGLTTAFTNAANLQGLTGEQLKIKKVLQKAYIKVNEQGTEAAAATFVQAVVCSCSVPSPKPPQFHADHPFAFFLVGSSDGTKAKTMHDMILFSGLYTGVSFLDETKKRKIY